MKPNFLKYFSLILIATMLFAVVYVSFKDLVETNPETFSIGLVTVLVVGMWGMMNNIISNAPQKEQNEY